MSHNDLGQCLGQQGKCAKMMPVMIWGILILAKKYGVKDFVLAILITLGCTLFLITGEVKSKAAKDSWDASMYGMLLMLGYLGFDGFTSTFQDRLFKGYQMTTYNQILYTTLCSSLLSAFGECLSHSWKKCIRNEEISLAYHDVFRWHAMMCFVGIPCRVSLAYHAAFCWHTMTCFVGIP